MRQATQPVTKAPELVGLFTIDNAETPQLYVDIDRTQCEKLGVDMQDAFDTLEATWAPTTSTCSTSSAAPGRSTSADQKYRTDERYLKMLKVGNTLGKYGAAGGRGDGGRSPARSW